MPCGKERRLAKVGKIWTEHIPPAKSPIDIVALNSGAAGASPHAMPTFAAGQDSCRQRRRQIGKACKAYLGVAPFSLGHSSIHATRRLAQKCHKSATQKAIISAFPKAIWCSFLHGGKGGQPWVVRARDEKEAFYSLSDPLRPPQKIAGFPGQYQGWGGGALLHQLVRGQERPAADGCLQVARTALP